MIGRSHGVHAEPITFGLKLLIWLGEVRRHRARLAEAREHIAVGKISGSVGTHANVPPDVEDWTCEELGLAVAPVSNQIVQRDRHAHFVCTLALIASSLDKFATELRSLQRTEIREAEEPFEIGRHGSSSMPHKRNPSRLERVSGLARLLRSHAQVALENVTLWHERDISHSSAERIILPDACLALDYMLYIFIPIARDMRVYVERMAANVDLTARVDLLPGRHARLNPRRHVPAGRLRNHAGTRHRVLGRRCQLPGRRTRRRARRGPAEHRTT